jgi:hypothetical protein
VARTEADEYVQITNYGSGAVDLGGWQLVDSSDGKPSFTFINYNLPPGGTIRVYTNEVHPEWGGFNFGSKTAIWSNSEPDTATLSDDNMVVISTGTYPPGCVA